MCTAATMRRGCGRRTGHRSGDRVMAMQLNRHRRLTPREIDVLTLVCRGRSSREIGSELHLAPGTVDKYVAHAITSYNARNRSHLAALAIADGLI